MTEFAQVVELPLARVVKEQATAPAIPIMKDAVGWGERIGKSPALFYKLHRAGRLPAYRFMTNSDPKRCPLLFAEEDVMALFKVER